MMQLNVVGYR